jgi:1,4-alpha-glucan branching enzyme
MWSFPGKKLLFMGGEIAQWNEWRSEGSVEWDLLQFPLHKGIQTLVADLNRSYVAEPALHATDNDPGRFRWLIADDADASVYAFLREAADGTMVVVVSNMTPVLREGYGVPVPRGGQWDEIVNSNAEIYGGDNRGNGGGIPVLPGEGGQAILSLTLPPLTTLFLRSLP